MVVLRYCFGFAGEPNLSHRQIASILVDLGFSPVQGPAVRMIKARSLGKARHALRQAGFDPSMPSHEEDAEGNEAGLAESSWRTPAAYAWAAGLFEGEGWVGAIADGRGPHSGKCARMEITSTDRDVLEQFLKVVGAGSVSGTSHAEPAYKPAWRWRLAGREPTRRLFTLFLPWLCQRRREQFEQTLAVAAPAHFSYGAPGPDCGHYAEVIPCSVGYEKHIYRGEPGCVVCRQCHRLRGRKNRPPRPRRAHPPSLR